MSPLGCGTATRPRSWSMARAGRRMVPSARRNRPGYDRPACVPRRGPARRVKIHEADAKSLLVAQGLPVPGGVARTPTQARAAAVRFLADPGNATRKVVIKAQVLVGGRGKAGGVRLAGTADEAEDVAAQILALEIGGLPVRRVLVGPPPRSSRSTTSRWSSTGRQAADVHRLR